MPDLPDFSLPQRQSAAGIVILFVDTFQRLVRALAIPLVVILVRSENLNIGYLLGFASLLTLLIGAVAYLQYRRFTFYLDEQHQEFVINKGIISRTNLTIQLDKIQQVNINQSLIQRLVGVYSLEIDTAGSDKKEAHIKAISKDLAEILKETLLARGGQSIHQNKNNTEISEVVQEPGMPFLKLSPATLLKIGITSNYGQTIALVMGFLLAAFEGLKDLNQVFFEIDKEEMGNTLRQSASVLSICFLITFILTFLLAINVIRTFLKYYDFKITRQNISLAISSGLFAKKNTLLNPHKVQISAYSQNYFQKKLNILDMRMKQKDSSTYDGTEVKKNDLEIPGCNTHEKEEILRMIFNELPERGVPLLPNYRYVYFSVLFWMALPLAAILISGTWFFETHRTYYPLIAPYLIFSGLLIYFGYRNQRLFVSEGYIIKKSGIWDVQHQILEPHKIQAISTTQMLWHRKPDIGHLTLHTAAGSFSFSFGNYKRINQLVNYWLYQVETIKKEWM